MTDTDQRFVRRQAPPDETELAEWLGPEARGHWHELARRIDAAYPGVFAPDWTFGGQKHGWSLRYKKSKSFCTFVPIRGGFAVGLVFGGAEREKMGVLMDRLGSRFCQVYAEAPTYHDGKWMLFRVLAEADLDDVMVALSAKRRPKPPVR